MTQKPSRAPTPPRPGAVPALRRSPRYRWFVVAVFLAFMLLHQADKLLIGPLTTPIMEEFGIDEAQMGAVTSGALAVGALAYLVWGYLYDRYARPKLLALASLLWGASTWLSAIAPTFRSFLVTRASTGIDDSSYPGVHSLVSDYFGPSMRGRVYGLLQLAAPLGYILGMVLALILGEAIGWRAVFYITGSVGVILAGVIFLGVREVPRGRSEPELAGLEEISAPRFSWQAVRGLFRRRSLLFLYAQGFFGVFPWNVITYWFFRYLETERGYDSEAVLLTMMVAVLVLAAGYYVGGTLGDFLFRRTRRGRMLVAAGGVFLGAILLWVALSLPAENQTLFLILVSVTALFIPFSAPNVISTLYDVAPPEVRSTASGVQYLIESFGAASAPFLAGLIARQSSLHNAILIVCESAWLVCGLLIVAVVVLVPRDIEALRQAMQERAKAEQAAGG